MEKIFEEDLGDTVLCDLCNEDFTTSKATGGLIFGSKAVCPICQPKLSADIVRHKEQSYVKAVNNEMTSFADFVRGIRGPDGSFIRIYTFD